jgi:hemoglobin-like flavoprotein
MAESLFKNGIVSQGKSFVKMMSIILSQLLNESKFESLMEKIANSHFQHGVKAVEYGIVGEVLFYTLQLTIGDPYTVAVELAWKKIYSKVIGRILPICVSLERSSSSSFI